MVLKLGTSESSSGLTVNLLSGLTPGIYEFQTVLKSRDPGIKFQGDCCLLFWIYSGIYEFQLF